MHKTGCKMHSVFSQRKPCFINFSPERGKKKGSGVSGAFKKSEYNFRCYKHSTSFWAPTTFSGNITS
ncbi:hypothetical protein B8133_25350 [Salmonella enterica]|nr:hypothetical protein [Salmonella enterica]